MSKVISNSVNDNSPDKKFTLEEAQAELQKSTCEKIELLAKQLTELTAREFVKLSKVGDEREHKKLVQTAVAPSSWWHGTASGDLRGGRAGLHVGTKKAATEALTATIGHPVEGEWDGTREYGKTLLAGRKTLAQRGANLSGYNVDAPDEDHYPDMSKKHLPAYLISSHKPEVFPLKITGPMSNSVLKPHSDTRSNALMVSAIKQGKAKNGHFYVNQGEDYGSISAALPGPGHIERIQKQVAEPVSKSLIPPHKHNVGMTVGGTEDVAPGRINPRGKNDAIKTELEDSASEESSGEKSVADIRADAKEKAMKLCKCGNELYKNELCKGCFAKMAKDEIDPDKIIDNTIPQPHPVPKEGGEVIASPGSSGDIKPNNSLKSLQERAKASSMAKSEEAPKLQWKETSDRLHSAKHDGKDYSISRLATSKKEPKQFKLASDYGEKHISTHDSLEGAQAAAHDHVFGAKKAEPPMAKPPSGKNMATHVPVSKPQAPTVAKGDFGMGDNGKASTLPAVSAPVEAPKPQYTMQNLKEGKAALKPGIFGKINKK